MSIELLHRIEKWILFLLIICLPITGLPLRYAVSGLGKTLSNYFLILGILVIVYEYIKFKYSICRNIIRYFFVYLGWQILCLVLGLYFYEYNEYLTINQIPKLEAILPKLPMYGFVVDELSAIKLWLFIRMSKNIIFVNNSILLLAFFIYHLYRDNWKQGFNDIRRAVLTLILIMGSYSFVELLWLKFQIPLSGDILKVINVILYDPENSHGWWPPLLWWGQLRSLCHEPSYFGIISILCLPFLWSLCFSNKYRFAGSLLLAYFTLMIAATNARTAIIVTFGQLFLLLFMSFLLEKKQWIKPLLTILLCTTIGFAVNLIDFKGLVGNKDIDLYSSFNQYADNNIVSVAKKDVRSNNARLANMVANFETIKDYPVLGVGTGLKDAYIDARLPEFSYSNNEVRNWSRYMHNEGVLKSGYPALNKYLDVAVQNGLVGLFLYLLPILYMLYKFYKILRYSQVDYQQTMAFISFVGLLVAQLSNADLIICNGVTWGLMMCIAFYQRG